MPSGPSSRARARVRPSIAAFAVWYALPHGRDHRLRAEELVLQVHVETVVPIGFVDLFECMAIVIGGIVDEDIERSAFLYLPCDRALDRRNFCEIDMEVAKAVVACVGEPLDERVGRFVAYVEEGHVRPLAHESLDNSGADAGAAASHEHAPAGQAWIKSAPLGRYGVIHLGQPPM
jgi:hypothetical protein